MRITAHRTRTVSIIRKEGAQSLYEMLLAYPPAKKTPCEAEGCTVMTSDRWCPPHKQEALDGLVEAVLRRRGKTNEQR